MADGLSAGMRFERVFSTEGEEFPLVERTAEIPDAVKGGFVFRQEGVLFPEWFSQTAVNVVASKYFYGDVRAGNGCPAEGRREHSLEQLVGRVVGTISDFGSRAGYFASEADAQTFRDELTHLAVHQYAAFNSPVWFNVGLYRRYGVKGDSASWRWDFDRFEAVPLGSGHAYSYPQSSACFIQRVDDTMESIMDLAKSEAMLFKAGSGTGSDLSTLRSTREKLTGGGRPSGPVSFFRIYDSIAGAIKSGGKTRRAARMQTLNCRHPDILEFIRCKPEEDAKARALIAAGYSSGMTGDSDEAYSSVAFQNTNVSIRVNDEFMSKASGEDPDPRYWTIAVTDGSRVDQLDAREVLDAIAEGTWSCGDPGLQYEDTINGWHTTPSAGRINSSNPCSEYLYIDDSACNLASIRLTKFMTPGGGFDVGRFKAAVRVLITAQEILVDMSSYPTRAIAENSHRHRPLGLGLADLGALLMRLGLPYDSDEGRSVAGAIGSLMQAAAAATSAALAAVKGPFEAYVPEEMRRVMRRHADAVRGRWAECAVAIWEAADRTWADEALPWGERYGYRNAQLSVMAPTGTISFLMDCDTTGIEPDLALVKYKSLSGGGTLKIVNQALPKALDNLGYSRDEADAIIRFVEERGTVEGCPELKPEHLPVFDCALAPAGGSRVISPEGHIRMMAAIQPSVSGSISKTINMPSSATVEDIRNAYILGWKLGLKSLAIYRDGSKGSQPLNTKAEDAKAEPFSDGERDRRFELLGRIMQFAADAVGERLEWDGGAIASASLERIAERLAARDAPGPPRREKLPDVRAATTRKFKVGGHKGYVTVGHYADGRPGEMFVTMAKEGSTVGGLMDAIAALTSIALQYGVPLEVLATKLSHTRFEPSGITNDPDAPFASSVVDYLFRRLALDHVPGYREAHSPNRDDDAPAVVRALEDLGAASTQSDAPPCGNCGAITRRVGPCHLCDSCGTTTGCG